MRLIMQRSEHWWKGFPIYQASWIWHDKLSWWVRLAKVHNTGNYCANCVKSLLTTKICYWGKDLKNTFRSPMLLLRTMVTSFMKVCCARETKQILQSALHSLRNTRSSSRFDLASLLQITNPSSRKLSKKFRNLIGTEKYWGLRNLAGSQCKTSKVNGTYEHSSP